jgi:hypothetical protein
MKLRLLTILALFPTLAFAAPRNFSEFIDLFLELIFMLIPLIITLSFFVFIWGLAKFLWKAGDVKSHEEGKNIMVWGLIGLFVMLSIGGILRFAYGDFGFSREFGVPTLPEN